MLLLWNHFLLHPLVHKSKSSLSTSYSACVSLTELIHLSSVWEERFNMDNAPIKVFGYKDENFSLVPNAEDGHSFR